MSTAAHSWLNTVKTDVNTSNRTDCLLRESIGAQDCIHGTGPSVKASITRMLGSGALYADQQGTGPCTEQHSMLHTSQVLYKPSPNLSSASISCWSSASAAAVCSASSRKDSRSSSLRNLNQHHTCTEAASTFYQLGLAGTTIIGMQ